MGTSQSLIRGTLCFPGVGSPDSPQDRPSRTLFSIFGTAYGGSPRFCRWRFRRTGKVHPGSRSRDGSCTLLWILLRSRGDLQVCLILWAGIYPSIGSDILNTRFYWNMLFQGYSQHSRIWSLDIFRYRFCAGDKDERDNQLFRSCDSQKEGYWGSMTLRGSTLILCLLRESWFHLKD